MRRLSILLVVVSALLLASCSITAQLDLLNNTNHPVLVQTTTETIRIDAGKTRRFKNLAFHRLIVDIGEKSYVYEIKPLPSSHVSWKGWGPFSKRIFYAQLEPDGKIWALGKRHKVPVEAFDVQPDGFPLEPIAP